MTSRARWLVVAAVALMASAYVLPLWRVDLIAPQYPEGLGMLIRIDGVVGLKENDLNSINGLNHYIGMKAIEPDAIPELRWMPWILAGLIAGGIAVAALGRRVPLYLYGVVLTGVLGAGLWDYWRWGYEYGHDLDTEHAIIKIPGMTYSPPVLGRKKLLNFTATSWPSSGGIALALAAGLVGAAIVGSVRGRRRAGARVGATGPASAGGAVSAAALVLALSGCAAAGPRAIALNEDQCGFCRMEISDARFASQVVTATGKVQVFDSVECLAGYLRAASTSASAGEAPRGVWVADAERGGAWVAAADAGFLVDATLRSPMGRVVAVASPEAARAAQSRLGGTPVSWTAVRTDSGGITAHGAH